MNGTVSDAHPKYWGEDKLTQYLDNYRHNQYTVFAKKRSEVRDLIAIDEMLCRLLEDLEISVPMIFFFRAHAAYRAAVGAILAGQLYEAQALLRGCLEQGGYAHYIGSDKSRLGIWLNRLRDERGKNAAREEFKHGKVRHHIRAANRGLGDIYQRLYDRSIDFGAHPNVQGLAFSFKVCCTENGEKQLLSKYLDVLGERQDLCMRGAAEVGLWVLRVAEVIYPERMEDLGLSDRIAIMRKRF